MSGWQTKKTTKCTHYIQILAGSRSRSRRIQAGTSRSRYLHLQPVRVSGETWRSEMCRGVARFRFSFAPLRLFPNSPVQASEMSSPILSGQQISVGAVSNILDLLFNSSCGVQNHQLPVLLRHHFKSQLQVPKTIEPHIRRKNTSLINYKYEEKKLIRKKLMT